MMAVFKMCFRAYKENYMYCLKKCSEIGNFNKKISAIYPKDYHCIGFHENYFLITENWSKQQKEIITTLTPA
jgi:hypothetical protein